MLKTKTTVLLLLLAALVIGGAVLLLRGNDDTWLCENGLWVRHGNPKSEAPLNKPCINKNLILEQPKANEVVQSPLIVRGRAKLWYFEGSFPIRLVDENDMNIQSYVQAQDDWMTDEFVSFEGKIEFNVSATTTAWLILEKDNPSGLPEFDEQSSVPVILLPTETMKIKAFFNNSDLDPEASCNKVFYVEREIPKTQAVARAAINELLKGATESEKDQGFFTSINPGVEIQSLVIENGVAKIDFTEQLQFQVGGSCRVSAIRAQIIETLKQFPTISDVIISINGRTEDILQP